MTERSLLTGEEIRARAAVMAEPVIERIENYFEPGMELGLGAFAAVDAIAQYINPGSLRGDHIALIENCQTTADARTFAFRHGMLRALTARVTTRYEGRALLDMDESDPGIQELLRLYQEITEGVTESFE